MKKAVSVPKCAYTGRPADYRIGAVEYKKRKLYQEAGAVVAEKVLEAIDHMQHVCFGTKLWACVMDLTGKIIYRADEADIAGFSAKEGWRQYIARSCH